ncbi:MAG: hypothetical protein GC192_04025 [Bacteroidetes bacterium]|nr:hypothetical protein [Bacteroidota bacterium]
MSQQIVEIDIEKLVLWTENPRDPIDSNADDQAITNKAWQNAEEKWNLLKLAKEMRSHYDLSELPTVVMQNDKPIVYDGNRRMILAKLKHGCVSLEGFDIAVLPEIPKTIPCNVCSKKIAIENVFRKHGDSGSWSPLDRDIFVFKFMGESKSLFLKLDEATGIISSNPHLNKGFVKKEIFNNEKLKDIGLDFKGDKLYSKHTKNETKAILEDISNKVAQKIITTRESRGNVIGVLDKENRVIIENNINNQPKNLHFKTTGIIIPKEETKKRTSRTKKNASVLFNGDLYLKPGTVSDLYRDIVDLYEYYLQNKSYLSQYFPRLIRMALRLLVETASNDSRSSSMEKYVENNFAKAKKELDVDNKTTLSTQNVTESTLVQLLHIGAHNYSATSNIEQTIAISIILGKMLTITHGK